MKFVQPYSQTIKELFKRYLFFYQTLSCYTAIPETQYLSNLAISITNIPISTSHTCSTPPCTHTSRANIQHVQVYLRIPSLRLGTRRDPACTLQSRHRGRQVHSLDSLD